MVHFRFDSKNEHVHAFGGTVAPLFWSHPPAFVQIQLLRVYQSQMSQAMLKAREVPEVGDIRRVQFGDWVVKVQQPQTVIASHHALILFETKWPEK